MAYTEVSIFNSIIIDCLTLTLVYKKDFAQSPRVLVNKAPLYLYSF